MNCKFHLFGVVKAAVIHGEPAAAMLGVDFDKAVAELNIAPRVILLRLNGGRNDWIDSDYRDNEKDLRLPRQ